MDATIEGCPDKFDVISKCLGGNGASDFSDKLREFIEKHETHYYPLPAWY